MVATPLESPDPVRRHVLLLAACQALTMTSFTVFFTLAALVGNALATDKSMATFPVAAFQVATMVTTIPAALLMQRIGRRAGFAVGISLGLLGSGLGLYAILSQSFGWFCLAATLLGGFSGFAGYYRFAAAEVASEAFRSRAISWVVAGGVVAALFGPQIATWTKDLFSETVFAGCFVGIFILQLLSALPLIWVRIPQLKLNGSEDSGRPLSQIMQQPVFVVAVLGSMFGYGVMVLVMTATPLAMVQDQFQFDQAAFVIQWHVLGMFAPSFFTGNLIRRFGLMRIILLGGFLSGSCVVLNLLSGGHLMDFWLALLLLGVGWNFMYVGSTTLLTEAYSPAEKAKTQAVHDFMMAGCVAGCALLSGQLLNTFRWHGVNLAGLPLIGIALGSAWWLQRQRTLATVKPVE